MRRTFSTHLEARSGKKTKDTGDLLIDKRPWRVHFPTHLRHELWRYADL
jgi:hypothetical protein